MNALNAIRGPLAALIATLSIAVPARTGSLDPSHAFGCIYRNASYRVAFKDNSAVASDDCGGAELIVFTGRQSHRCSSKDAPTINLWDLCLNVAYAEYYGATARVSSRRTECA